MKKCGDDGYVSIWLGTSPVIYDEVKDVDTLKDLCGVESYDIDGGEADVSPDGLPQPIEYFIRHFSFSSTFCDAAVSAARKLGITEAYSAVAQFDFRYDPAQAVRKIADDPKFIGYFEYSTEELWDQYPELAD